MASCKTCALWKTEYDQFRQDFDDMIVVDAPDEPSHFCIMYDEPIPPDIYDGKADCPYHEPKESI